MEVMVTYDNLFQNVKSADQDLSIPELTLMQKLWENASRNSPPWTASKQKFVVSHGEQPGLSVNGNDTTTMTHTPKRG